MGVSWKMIEKCYIIPVSNKCNCDCLFCTNKLRDYKNASELKCDEKFIENLFLLKKRGIKEFEIIGEEPLLNNNLNLITSTIKKIIPDSYIKLHTNGNILKKIEGVDEIDILVVHHDRRVNNRFMKSSNYVDLLKKLKFFKDENIKIKLHIPIIKGGIDSREELEHMILKTKEYVDEYVMKKLFDASEELYTDFECKKESVIFEDNKNINGLLLWCDGNLYNDCNLNKKRNLYSYLLLKPDSRTYINEIVELINKNNFKIVSKKITDDFVNTSLLFYQEKDDEYLKFIKIHLDYTSALFGNQGIILILDKECSIEQLVEDTYNLKKQIRSLYSLTHSMNGYIRIDDKDFHLNIVHCPDPDIETFDRDINIINNLYIKEINDYEFQLIKKYRSYNL